MCVVRGWGLCTPGLVYGGQRTTWDGGTSYMFELGSIVL